jgi:hypothetical protein
MPTNRQMRDFVVTHALETVGMAAPTKHGVKKTYTLYWRCRGGGEPTLRANVNGRTVIGYRYGSGRGGIVQTYARYKDLVADAQKRAIAAGYPKTRWMDCFDWGV